MFDRKEFYAQMVRNGYNQETIAKELGMTKRTLYTRIKTGNFNVKEIEQLIKVLHLKRPFEIFFN